MKHKKAITAIVFVFLLIAIVIFLLLPLLAQYVIDINKYRPLISRTLTEEIGKEVELGELYLSLFWGIKLTAKDVTIKDSKTIAPEIINNNILSISKVAANISPLSLLSGRLKISKIVLVSPLLNVIRHEDGSLNIGGDIAVNSVKGVKRNQTNPDISLAFFDINDNFEVIPAAFSPEDKIEKLFKIKSVFVKRIEIHKGRFIFSAEKSGNKTHQFVELNGIDFTIDLHSPLERHNLLQDIKALKFFSIDIAGYISSGNIFETRITNINLSGSLDERESVLESLSFSAYDGVVNVKGVLKQFSDMPLVELTIDASNIKFHELLNAISDEENLVMGTLDLTGVFNFPIKNMDYFIQNLKGSGNISVIDGTIPEFSIRDEIAKSLGIPSASLPKELNTSDFDYMGGEYKINFGKLFTNDFCTTGPSYNSTAKGFLGFDKRLDFSGYIYPNEKIVKSSLFEKITTFLGIGGKLDKIPFTLTGTLDNVKFKIEHEGLTDEVLRNFLGVFGF